MKRTSRKLKPRITTRRRRTPTTSRTPATRPPVSRRRFIELLAAGSLATALAPAAALAATDPARSTATPAPRPARTPAIENGIREQKQSLAKQLRTLRGYRLPPGSDMAFVFTPMKPRRSR